jgi:penicillin-binding protein 2
MINDELQNRKYVIGGLIALIILIFIARLLFLQVFTESYKESAEGNAFLKRIIFPPRGLIYDRNGKLLVYNRPSYDVMVTMKEVTSLDTMDFCNTIGITKEEFVDRIEEIKDKKINHNYSPFTPQMFINQLLPDDYARLMEKIYRFPGFSIQQRTIRDYAYKSAAHALGSIGEVSRATIEKDDYYKMGDYIGITGLEKSYEEELRGEKGVQIMLRDSRGRIKGRYANGAYDEEPVSGKTLKLGLDIELQMLGERLMNGKRGSIVAIEPSTGEILAAVSSPTYDPALMVGRQRSAIFKELNSDPQKPLLDRTVMARYPPGSTFKVANALALQQNGIISGGTRYPCHHGYSVGRFHLACHAHASPLDLYGAIANSCNAYFCFGLRAMLDNNKFRNIADAFNTWRTDIMSFGFGKKLGVDLPHENGGNIPSTKAYDRIHGKGRWRSLNVVSISIGQGEVVATAMQIANLCATVANRGHWITPHLVKSIENEAIPEKYTLVHTTAIDKPYYDVCVRGMEMAVLGGTAKIAQIPGIEVCGKTGTAQDGVRKDHSVFMGFAPKVHPKIAIMCIVENSGFGATYAAPISSLLMEFYLRRKISPERQFLVDRMEQTILIRSYGTQNKVSTNN